MEDWNQTAHTFGFETEREMWLDLYIRREKGIIILSELFKCGTATIIRRLKASGVQARPKGGANNVEGLERKIMHIDPRLLLRPAVELEEMLKIPKETIERIRRRLNICSSLS